MLRTAANTNDKNVVEIFENMMDPPANIAIDEGPALQASSAQTRLFKMKSCSVRLNLFPHSGSLRNS
jgi:hypothetical protein